MSKQQVNLSAHDIKEQLNANVNHGWKLFVGELDALVIERGDCFVSFITTLNITDGNYSFTVSELFANDESDSEQVEDFQSYNGCLNHIDRRIKLYVM